ncbi:MAG TPA: CHC2 zinc finger domain-containing protein [Thermoanaerobaculia bacterium]|jgi:DNA primase|nr:CHC2 zinc finger domain-containing protein [Thermoanaerobaculia bacterium]
MFKPLLTPRDIAERYNRFLPEEIGRYLKGRGIPATLIEQKLLGWDGSRKHITIPVFGMRPSEVLGFRYAKMPNDASENPEMIKEPDTKPEIYGLETLARVPYRVVICEGEFDRLALEARGIAAVNSTAGAAAFLDEWKQHFEAVEHVFVCFNRSIASDAAAKAVQRILPKARIARLPADVGENGTIADFFVRLGRKPEEFERVLATGTAAVDDPADLPPPIAVFRPVNRSLRQRAERLRKAVRLDNVVSQFTSLHAEGGRLVGHCPLHDDFASSLTVYPAANTYRCSGCEATGDVVTFLMNKESMTFGKALEALERFEFTHELYGTS